MFKSVKCICVFACLLSALSAYGQVSSTAPITGVISDSTGAVIPGANVTAKNNGTSAQFETISIENGTFDDLFRSGRAEELDVAIAVREAALAQGNYRLSHLETHRRMRSLLTDEQIALYDELRGYGARHPHASTSTALRTP